MSGRRIPRHWELGCPRLNPQAELGYLGYKTLTLAKCCWVGTEFYPFYYFIAYFVRLRLLLPFHCTPCRIPRYRLISVQSISTYRLIPILFAWPRRLNKKPRTLFSTSFPACRTLTYKSPWFGWLTWVGISSSHMSSVLWDAQRPWSSFTDAHQDPVCTTGKSNPLR